MESIYRKKIRISDLVMYGLIYLSAFLAVLLLVGILVYVFLKGAGQVNRNVRYCRKYCKYHLHYCSYHADCNTFGCWCCSLFE